MFRRLWLWSRALRRWLKGKPKRTPWWDDPRWDDALMVCADGEPASVDDEWKIA